MLAICHLTAACASVSPHTVIGLVTACGRQLLQWVLALQGVFLWAGTPLGLVRAWGQTLPIGDRLVT